MVPAVWVMILGAVVAGFGIVGMHRHKAKAWGYLSYCLGIFAVGTVTMLDAPSLASICLAGFCYTFALLTICAAAFGKLRDEEEKAHAGSEVQQGQVHGEVHEGEGRHS